MSTESIVIMLLIGAVAGWLAGQIRQGFGFGLVGNIIIGILGSFVGSWLFGRLGVGMGGGILGAILTSTTGAVVILFLLSLVRKA